MFFLNAVSIKDSMQNPDINNVKKTRNEKPRMTRSAVFLVGMLCSHGVTAGAPIPGVLAWILRDSYSSYALTNPSVDIAGEVIRYTWIIRPNSMCTVSAVRDNDKAGVDIDANYIGNFLIIQRKMAGQINSEKIKQPVNVTAYFSGGGVSGDDGENIAVGASTARSEFFALSVGPLIAQCELSAGPTIDKTVTYRIDVPRGVLPAGEHQVRLSSRGLYFYYAGLNGPNVGEIGGAVLATARPFLSSSAGTLSLAGDITVNNYCRLESSSAEINHGTVSGNQVEGNTASTSFRVMCNNPVTTKITAAGLTSGNELMLGTGLKSTITATVNGQSVDFSSPNKDYTLNDSSNLINLASTLHFKSGETLQAGDYNKSFVMNITYQ